MSALRRTKLPSLIFVAGGCSVGLGSRVFCEGAQNGDKEPKVDMGAMAQRDRILISGKQNSSEDRTRSYGYDQREDIQRRARIYHVESRDCRI